MPLNKAEVRKALDRLNWTKGLTKEQIMLDLGAGRELDEELYHHLPAKKEFHSAREVIESLPKSVWTGVGDKLHEKQEVFGPKVAPDSAARGKTSLAAQEERTRELDVDDIEGREAHRR